MPRQLSTLLILLFSLLLCGAGVAMVAAGVARYQAEAFLEDWEGKAAEPEENAWEVAAAAARRAVAWYPVGNGDYLDRLGRVYTWRFYRQPLGSEAALASLLPAGQAEAIDDSRRGAQAAFRASVAVRPGWPGSWVRLAHANFYLGRLDSEFGAAYARAAQLGAWQWWVRLELAEIGLTAWSSLSDDQREVALESALRATAGGVAPAQAVGRLAAQAGVESQVCQRATPADVRILEVCRFDNAIPAGGG